MTGPSVLQLLPVLLLAAAGVWVLWVCRRGPRVVGGEPCCANCGYLVRGLPGPICPECGADLRAPGAVATAGGRRPAGKWRLALGWSAFSFFTVWIGFTFIWWTFVIQRLPHIREVQQHYALGNPASRAYDAIEIRATARAAVREGRPDPKPTTVTVRLRTSQGQFDLDVDTNTWVYEYVDANGAHKRGAPLDVPALLAWLHDEGVQGDTAQLTAEMDLVLGELRSVQQTGQAGRHSVYPAFGSSANSSSLGTRPLPYVQSVPQAAALIVWVIGILMILARNPGRGRMHPVTF